MKKSRTTIAIPPGATIKEQLEERGMKQKEFAWRMGMSEKHISHLINGSVQLTPDCALRLEMVLGIPASFWNNLEAIYQEALARVKAENNWERERAILQTVPYEQMVQLQWIPETENEYERAVNCRKFFRVASLSCLNDARLHPDLVLNKESMSCLAWLEQAKKTAAKQPSEPIQKDTLTACLQTNDFRLASLSQCGLAVVYVPPLPHAPKWTLVQQGKNVCLAVSDISESVLREGVEQLLQTG